MAEGLAARMRGLRAMAAHGNGARAERPAPRPAPAADDAPVRPEPPVPARAKPSPTRRVEQVLLLAVPAEFLPQGLRMVRVLRAGGDWFYELVEPAAVDRAAVEYAQTVLGHVRGATPPERVRQAMGGRRVVGVVTVAVPDPMAEMGVRIVRILRGGDDWCYEVVEPTHLDGDILAFVQTVVRDLR